MKLNDLVVEEVKNTSDQVFWKIKRKETSEALCDVFMKEKGNAVIEIAELMFCDCLKQKDEITAALECLLNQLYYRRNMRKVLILAFSNDVLRKEVVESFGFHLDSVCEMENENQEIRQIETYSLYKEEYIGWLRKKGKTLGFLRTKDLKMVFLFVSLIGVGLLMADMLQKNSDLQTLFYAYMTGIGAAGTIACGYMEIKQKRDENHAG